MHSKLERCCDFNMKPASGMCLRFTISYAGIFNIFISKMSLRSSRIIMTTFFPIKCIVY